MKYSGLGGQAVMEGVMMKYGDKYAVAVRKPDHEITVETSACKPIGNGVFFRNWMIVRGILNFIDSLYLGMKTLMYSSTFFEEEEEEKEKENKKDPEKKEKEDKAMIGATMTFSVVLAIAIFMVLPYYLSRIFQKVISSETLLALIEGVIRLIIFLLYIVAISAMQDIQRVFMYHGAEHKCINCIEHGMPLTVENVRVSSRQHKRCGTSFLLIVMLISIVFFAFVRVDSQILRLLLRLLLIPVIAGVSYEFLRFAGKHDNVIVNVLSKPGLWLQKLTTREPDDEMIEVGIASVEAVFDWKEYLSKESA